MFKSVVVNNNHPTQQICIGWSDFITNFYIQLKSAWRRGRLFLIDTTQAAKIILNAH